MAFKKTGSVTSTRFSNLALLEDMEIKTLSDNSVWAKIFEHNNQSGTVLFSSISEVLNTQTTNKYSRLYMISSLKASDGKLELMLEYPDTSTTLYNRWKQTNAPQDEFVTETSAGTGTAAGYEAVHCDWTGSYWGGITRQLSSSTTVPTNTYLSGSVGHSNWWYAIGAFSAYQGGIPGPSSVITGRAQIWVRIDTLPDVTKLQLGKSGSLASNDIYEV